jgi:hypothetical protein
MKREERALNETFSYRYPGKDDLSRTERANLMAKFASRDGECNELE